MDTISWWLIGGLLLIGILSLVMYLSGRGRGEDGQYLSSVNFAHHKSKEKERR